MAETHCSTPSHTSYHRSRRPHTKVPAHSADWSTRWYRRRRNTALRRTWGFCVLASTALCSWRLACTCFSMTSADAWPSFVSSGSELFATVVSSRFQPSPSHEVLQFSQPPKLQHYRWILYSVLKGICQYAIMHLQSTLFQLALKHYINICTIFGVKRK